MFWAILLSTCTCKDQFYFRNGHKIHPLLSDNGGFWQPLDRTEQATVKKIGRKLLSTCPRNFPFSLSIPMPCLVFAASCAQPRYLGSISPGGISLPCAVKIYEPSFCIQSTVLLTSGWRLLCLKSGCHQTSLSWPESPSVSLCYASCEQNDGSEHFRFYNRPVRVVYPCIKDIAGASERGGGGVAPFVFVLR